MPWNYATSLNSTRNGAQITKTVFQNLSSQPAPGCYQFQNCKECALKCKPKHLLCINENSVLKETDNLHSDIAYYFLVSWSDFK